MQENPRELGGGVAVLNVEPGSHAAGLDLRPGIQLLAAGGLPVHGMSLENAVRPIEAAEKKVQLTFFKGTAAPRVRARFSWHEFVFKEPLKASKMAPMHGSRRRSMAYWARSPVGCQRSSISCTSSIPPGSGRTL